MDPKDPSLLGQVFNDKGFLLLFFGALGSLVRGLALKTGLWETVRIAAIGSFCAFGVGALSPYVLKPWIGDLPENLGTTIGGICSLAFLIGLTAVTLVEMYAAKTGGKSP